MADDPTIHSTSERDRLARSRGYDRRGPHADGSRPEGGFSCCCEWASCLHGDECPEHGDLGTPIPDELEAVRAERDAARAEVARLKGGLP